MTRQATLAATLASISIAAVPAACGSSDSGPEAADQESSTGSSSTVDADFVSRADAACAAYADYSSKTFFRISHFNRYAPDAALLPQVAAYLRQNPAYAPAWLLIADLAGKNQLDLEQKRKWAELLQKLCGQKYPDFALAVLGPMISTVQDPAEQARLWQAAQASFQSRPDLAADVRMHEAEVYEQAGDLAKAVAATRAAIAKRPAAHPRLIITSSAEGTGLAELRAEIAALPGS